MSKRPEYLIEAVCGSRKLARTKHAWESARKEADRMARELGGKGMGQAQARYTKKDHAMLKYQGPGAQVFIEISRVIPPESPERQLLRECMRSLEGYDEILAYKVKKFLDIGK